jgi:hypothetical protein
MAAFLGRVNGQRGPGASRLGSSSSGIRVCAQSWHGSLSVELSEVSGQIWVEIHSAVGSESYPRTLLYRGPMAEVLKSTGFMLRHT